MAVAFDNSAVTYSGSVLASIDQSFTPGSGSDMVILAAHWVHRGGRTSSSVVYDPAGSNVAFTKLGNQTWEISAGSGTIYDLALYILKDANISKSTAKIIRATNNDSARQGILVASFTGVDQTTSTGTLQLDKDEAATGTTVSNSVSSSTGDMVVDFLAMGTVGTLPVEDVSQTEFSGVPLNMNSTAGSGSYEAGAASVSMGWSWSGSRNYNWLGVNLLQAGGGGGGGSTGYEVIQQYYRHLIG